MLFFYESSQVGVFLGMRYFAFDFRFKNALSWVYFEVLDVNGTRKARL